MGVGKETHQDSINSLSLTRYDLCSCGRGPAGLNAGGTVDWEAARMTIGVLSGRWEVAILDELRRGPRRRNRLRREIQVRPLITDNVFTETLHRLEQRGLVGHRDIPARHVVGKEYSLTSLGHSIIPVLESLAAWGQAHAAEVEQAERRFAETHGEGGGALHR
jgi:DNA-binding HxlR family transcriptional regulator